MVENKTEGPLDLSTFDVEDPSKIAAPKLPAIQPPSSDHLPVTTTDVRLVPQPRPERLVEVSKLSPQDLDAANRSAARLDFRNTNTLMAHADGVLAVIAQGSR
jgi:hypothetical protein